MAISQESKGNLNLSPAPRPKGLPILGLLPQLSRDPLGFFTRMGHANPTLVRLDLGPRHMNLVTHPTWVRYILQDNHRNYMKGYGTARTVLGNGLVTAEGEEWMRERRLMQPAFNRSHLETLLPLMASATQEALDDWGGRTAQGQPLDMAREFMLLTQTIIVRTMFSVDLGEQAVEIASAFATSLEYLNAILLSPVPHVEKLPTAINRRFKRSKQFLDEVIANILRSRREKGQERRDLVAMLMAARDEESGQGMSDQQMHDEIITIFLAGHETTATLLAWTVYLLALHPQVEEQVRAEFERELGSETPGMEEISCLTYTRQVLEEALRLYPPAWIFARTPVEDDSIGGYRLPAGEMVMLSPYATQRMPEFWPQPETFDPSRFSPEASAGRPNYAWFPFGGGPRLCIGKPFALMEAPLILAMLMRRFRLNLAPGQHVHPQPVASLRPKPAIWMHFKPI